MTRSPLMERLLIHEMGVVRLELPVPPSPNRWAKHPMVEHRQKRRYQKAVWLAANNQALPSASPPERVVVLASLYLVKLRDEDNAVASLKWALDALRQKQSGKLAWRSGVAENKGYFVDDDERLRLHVSQFKVAKRAEESLHLTIRPA